METSTDMLNLEDYRRKYGETEIEEIVDPSFIFKASDFKVCELTEHLGDKYKSMFNTNISDESPYIAPPVTMDITISDYVKADNFGEGNLLAQLVAGVFNNLDPRKTKTVTKVNGRRISVFMSMIWNMSEHVQAHVIGMFTNCTVASYPVDISVVWIDSLAKKTYVVTHHSASKAIQIPRPIVGVLSVLSNLHTNNLTTYANMSPSLLWFGIKKLIMLDCGHLANYSEDVDSHLFKYRDIVLWAMSDSDIRYEFNVAKHSGIITPDLCRYFLSNFNERMLSFDMAIISPKILTVCEIKDVVNNINDPTLNLSTVQSILYSSPIIHRLYSTIVGRIEGHRSVKGLHLSYVDIYLIMIESSAI